MEDKEKKEFLKRIRLEDLTEKDKRYLLSLLIQKKLDHQKGSTKEYYKTIFGSILILIATILPFLDNIIIFFFPTIDDIIKISFFHDFTSALWTFSVSFSPFIIIISIFYQVHKLIYIFPTISFLISAVATLANSTGFYISGNIQFYIWMILISFFTILYYRRIYNYIRLKKISEELKMDLVQFLLKK